MNLKPEPTMKRIIKFTQNSKNFLIVFPVLLLVVMACTSNNNDQTEEDLNYLEGNYVGTWNSKTPSTTYSNFKISTRIQVSASNEVTGTFFYTDNFKVCCSEEESDGTFTIDIDNDLIRAFRLNDTQNNCAGVFTGHGKYREEDKSIVIDFIGNDCKGDHIGQIILVRQ